MLKDLKIDVVLNDRATIPATPTDGPEWDGSSGPQNGSKVIKLESGKKLEADYVFVSVGNKPNVSLVEAVDKGAITQGLIAVDEYLKVSLHIIADEEERLTDRSSPNLPAPS